MTEEINPSDSSFEQNAIQLKSILMIEPVSFGFNEETASTNSSKSDQFLILSSLLPLISKALAIYSI